MRLDTPPLRSRGRALRARDRYEAAPAPLAEPRPERRYAGRKVQPERCIPKLSPCSAAPLGSPEWHRSVVRHIAKYMPQKERSRRGLSAIDNPEAGDAKYDDRRCPGCVDTPSWLDLRVLERCPLCVGFQFIPQVVLTWYTGQRQALEALAASQDRQSRRGKILEARA